MTVKKTSTRVTVGRVPANLNHREMLEWVFSLPAGSYTYIPDSGFYHIDFKQQIDAIAFKLRFGIA